MSKQANQTNKSFYIKVNPKDNVAIVVNEGGLPEGTVFDNGLVLKAFVPQGHKVALGDLDKGTAVVRYGEVIGHAVRWIEKGSWIDESLVTLPSPPQLDDLPIANKVPVLLPPLEGYVFEGYRNEHGSVGTKNILGITTSVQCVAGVLDYAVKRIKAEVLHRFPNVDDVVALNHSYGCGVAIDAPEAIIPIRTVRNIATHPNFGGEILVVGLGCEKLLPERILPEIDASDVILLQDQLGFTKMVESILEAAKKKLRKLDRRRRVTCPISDLVIGLQCGGSDAFSGVTANPAVGYAADLLSCWSNSLIF